MEWSRAKNILIMAFLCLNLILGYRLWHVIAAYPVGTAQIPLEEVINTQQYLVEVGIKITPSIPREVASLPLLNVQVAPFNNQQVAEFFLGTVEDVEIIWAPESPGKVVFVRNGEELSIYPDGIVSYQYTGFYIGADSNKKTNYSQEANRWAQAYVTGQGEWGQELIIKEIRPLPGDGRYVIRLEQVYEEIPLVGSAGVEVVWNKGQIEFFWQRMLEPLGPVGEAKTVIPATEALHNLAAGLQELPAGDFIVIDEITLGYYNKLYDARQWEAVPVWAFKTDAGHWYYINAFTGEAEQ